MMRQLSLEEIKQLEIGILDYVVEVCDKNSIKYFLSYGTLLGAVRHRGFIPWDDDIDLVMLRDDYNRFLKIIEKAPHPRYRVLTPKDKGYFYTFVKVVDTETNVVEEEVEQMPVNGVWVDIFPLDGVKKISSIHTKFCYLLNKCRGASIYKNFPKEKGISYFSWKICKLIGPRLFLSVFETICQRYRLDDCNYVSVISNPYKNMFEKSIFNDIILLNFEGKKYSCPHDYDKLLTILYGNYMLIPKEENRIRHHMNAFSS